jgi:hypothetical protein
MSDEYTKQLERENELLKTRLEEADFKANCYDVIMNNVIYDGDRGFITNSTILTDSAKKSIKGISLRVELDLKKSPQIISKIINDYIEDKKAMAGSKR